MKNANSESFPNYEVKKELSNEFQLFDATYKVLLVKFHQVETLNLNMIKTYGFKSIFDQMQTLISETRKNGFRDTLK